MGKPTFTVDEIILVLQDKGISTQSFVRDMFYNSPEGIAAYYGKYIDTLEVVQVVMKRENLDYASAREYVEKYGNVRFDR